METCIGSVHDDNVVVASVPKEYQVYFNWRWVSRDRDIDYLFPVWRRATIRPQELP